MATVQPKSEAQIITDGLIPARSICDIEVIEATDSTSKSSGNDMIVLKLKVFHDGKTKVLTDYITFGQSNAEEFKQRRACDTFGILNAYNSGKLFASDFEGKSGQAKISVQTDKTGNYPDKNAIGEYLVRPVTAEEAPF